MRFTSVLLFGTFLATSLAASEQEVNFLEAFVSDYNNNKMQYVKYFLTATGVPPQVTLLAKQVVTYTDDSYTTLLDNSDLQVGSIMSFATNLPWYLRIEADVTSLEVSGSGSASASDSASTNSGSSSSTYQGSGVTLLAPGSAVMGVLVLALL